MSNSPTSPVVPQSGEVLSMEEYISRSAELISHGAKTAMDRQRSRGLIVPQYKFGGLLFFGDGKVFPVSRVNGWGYSHLIMEGADFSSSKSALLYFDVGHVSRKL